MHTSLVKEIVRAAVSCTDLFYTLLELSRNDRMMFFGCLMKILLLLFRAVCFNSWKIRTYVYLEISKSITDPTKKLKNIYYL